MFITQKIITLIKVCDKKQVELAKACGQTASGLSRYLSGKHDMSSSKFVKLLSSLGVDLEKAISDQIYEKMGERKAIKSLGDAAEVVISNVDRLDQKTFIDELIDKSSEIKDLELRNEVLGFLTSSRKKIATGRLTSNKEIILC